MKNRVTPKPGPTNRSLQFSLLLVLSLLVLTISPAGNTYAGKEVMIDGVRHIQNSDKPANGIDSVEMEELWRIGGDDDDSILLGLIAEVLVDDDNNCYLFDSALSHIEVFSESGEHLKTLGRQGSGPGEINGGFDIVFMPDGTLGMVQIFPGKIVKVDREGVPAGEFNPTLHEATAGRFVVLVNSFGAGGNLILTGIDMNFDQTNLTQTRDMFLSSFAADGTPLVNYHAETRIWDFNDFTLTEALTDFVWSRTDVGDDGRVVVNIPRNEYAISVFSADGQLEMVIDREYESWSRNSQATARADALLSGQMRQMPPGAEYKVHDLQQDVESIFIHDDGSIWVVNSRQVWDIKPGVIATYDVFDTKGNFTKQVEVKGQGNPSSDALFFAKNGLVFQVTGFQDAMISAVGGANNEDAEESEPMEVICYRIK